MAVTSSCVVYSQPEGLGNAHLYWLGPGARYLGASALNVYQDLHSWGEDGKIRSIRVYPAPDGSGGTAAILIPRSPFWVDNYISPWVFFQIHRVSDLGVPYDVSGDLHPLADLDSFTKKAYLGLIVVNTRRPGRSETMRSIRGIVDQFASQLSTQFNAKGLSLEQGPKVSWFWSQADEQYLQPQRSYAQLFLRFKYDPDSIWFDDYQVDVRLWVDFWVAGGALNAAIVRGKYHVSDGKLAKYVGAIADLAVKLGILQANTGLIPQALSTVNGQLAAVGRTPTDAYVLPGDQAPAFTLFGNTLFFGDARKDATLVIETQS
jgi:hypothetical protein